MNDASLLARKATQLATSSGRPILQAEHAHWQHLRCALHGTLQPHHSMAGAPSCMGQLNTSVQLPWLTCRTTPGPHLIGPAELNTAGQAPELTCSLLPCGPLSRMPTLQPFIARQEHVTALAGLHNTPSVLECSTHQHCIMAKTVHPQGTVAPLA